MTLILAAFGGLGFTFGHLGAQRKKGTAPTPPPPGGAVTFFIYGF